jgi:hypothetical protein
MAAIEPRSEGPLVVSGQGARVTRRARAQLRSERGAGVVSVDDVSAAAGAAEVSVDDAAGAAEVSVVVVVVVSVGAVLFSVEAGSVVPVALFDIELLSVVAAGVAGVVVVVVVSVDCATAAPMPASRAAAAATADSFF